MNIRKRKTIRRLNAPCPHYYFLAGQLQYLVRWIQKDKHNNLWTELEQNQSRNTFRLTVPRINSTLTACWKVNNTTKSAVTPRKYTPNCYKSDFQQHNNPTFLYGSKNHSFESCVLKLENIYDVKDSGPPGLESGSAALSRTLGG